MITKSMGVTKMMDGWEDADDAAAWVDDEVASNDGYGAGYEHVEYEEYDDDDEEVEEELPIGYTIAFSPPPEAPADAPRGGTGSQVLPVARRGPASGIPLSGEEYLFIVREEARALRPRVAAAAATAAPSVPATGTVTQARPPDLPSDAWRDSFIRRLRNMRDAVAAFPPAQPLGADALAAIPGARDESNWRLYINGKRADADANIAGADTLARAPDAATVTALDHPTLVQLVGHIALWINERLDDRARYPLPLPAHFAAWLFALLTRISDILTADDVSTLRAAAKACRRVAAERGLAGDGSASDAVLASAWCTIAAVAEIWRQRDLWP